MPLNNMQAPLHGMTLRLPNLAVAEGGFARRFAAHLAHLETRSGATVESYRCRERDSRRASTSRAAAVRRSIAHSPRGLILAIGAPSVRPCRV